MTRNDLQISSIHTMIASMTTSIVMNCGYEFLAFSTLDILVAPKPVNSLIHFIGENMVVLVGIASFSHNYSTSNQ